MDAVKTYLKEKGGDIRVVLMQVEDLDQVPFYFEVDLPQNLCFVDEH